MQTGYGHEQTNRAAAVAIDQLTLKVRAATESMKGLSAAASAGGMQSLNSGFALVGSTIGSVLAPAFVLLNAGVMTVADLLWNDMKPGLASTVDGFVKFAEQLITATSALYQFVKGATETAKFLADPDSWNLAKAVREKGAADAKGEELDQKLFEGNVRRNHPGDFPNAQRPKTIEEMHGIDDAAMERAGFLEGMQDGAPAGGEGPEAAKGPNIKKMFADNLRGIISDSKMSMGGGASFGGIGDAWKKMQISSSQNNFQAKMMDRWTETIKLLEGINRGIDEQPQAVGP